MIHDEIHNSMVRTTASSFASPNTKFDQTQTTASPKEEATFSGTPESPPPFDFFSPGGVDASGGRRRPGSGAAGFAASPPFSPNLFSPLQISTTLLLTLGNLADQGLLAFAAVERHP